MSAEEFESEGETLHLELMQEQRQPLLALERLNQRLRELLKQLLEGCE